MKYEKRKHENTTEHTKIFIKKLFNITKARPTKMLISKILITKILKKKKRIKKI